jgi:hypothetical protein
MGRSRLRHVNNPAVEGHFDTDTPPSKPGMRIPGLNVPRDGRGTAAKAVQAGSQGPPRKRDTPFNIRFAFVTKLS